MPTRVPQHPLPIAAPMRLMFILGWVGGAVGGGGVGEGDVEVEGEGEDGEAVGEEDGMAVVGWMVGVAVGIVKLGTGVGWMVGMGVGI